LTSCSHPAYGAAVAYTKASTIAAKVKSGKIARRESIEDKYYTMLKTIPYAFISFIFVGNSVGNIFLISSVTF
jgi:hypothetical protein